MSGIIDDARNQSSLKKLTYFLELLVAWSLLMEDRFAELRSCIYTTEEELKRFRQLLVNAYVYSSALNSLASTSLLDPLSTMNSTILLSTE